MSCKVEIIVQQYEDAVYIPVQAVIRIAGQPAVYVVKEGTIEEREVKIGLDNNRMIRIIDGIQEGEVVLLTPPLKSASIEDASGMINGGRAESSDELDTLKQRINEQLNGTNGTKTGGPDTPLDMKERREMQQRLLGAGKEQGESQKQGRDVRPQGTERNR
jgi:HlyD family secretion protein